MKKLKIAILNTIFVSKTAIIITKIFKQTHENMESSTKNEKMTPQKANESP